MLLTPLSRYAMRGMKAKEDERKRIIRVNKYISNIYRTAVDAAKNLGYTACSYEINTEQSTREDIIRGLQELFPGCIVIYTVNRDNNVIVIDWS
jgi:hypothetical protein